MKTNTKTMRTIMFISLVIAMVLIPANTATANEFMQNRKEYETALNHTVTLTARLKQDTENIQNKTIVTRDDDNATRIARKALQSQLTEATKIHMSQKEKATVFTVSSLTDKTVKSNNRIHSLIRSIDRTAKSVDTAIASHKLNDMRKKLADMVDKGKRILESSNGNVDDENNRDKLSDLLEKAKDLMESTDVKTMSVDVSELDKLINKVSDDMNARQARIGQERQQSVVAASYSQASNITSGNYTPTRSNYGSYTPTQSTPRGYYSSMSCDLTSAADHCQGAVDGGGIVDLNYGNGHVYAQHNNTGGAWINNLQAGQTFTMNGSTYRVNGQSVQGAQYAPDSGDWMQTCNGNGNHLVGITKIS